ncbi:tetratricopeptide repeat-containing sulfotransferase family protein [Xanthomonas hortorum]|uniref:Sulfotransferase family protein n=1 Tax=Xanthomonas hortorum pv. pelargonii TaxID=453602 RepID=A0A6V7F4V0_9XANT|nr:sulfotransferase [Xanthomonas hortorum]MCE4353051.1 sulfotransferase [Xanthomonas hortorum pv. pelargonii]MCM5524079.1 sulfotransferase [Xanthomonas hortorum pv. pelargonii]MCM5536609.1 sulfotransferase [Xanthomonas hortorum pv. pelargonii]MCM5540895.1 sulfotransferase [Xanthomonas hortorum pv. pelargonii]MCM5545805.1 sulfotransferase [Xanthomonas hortorum pv. pelargonii]
MAASAGAVHWQTAQAALARRDLGVAASALQALLAVDPTHVSARVLLAGTVLANGRMREAVAQLRLAARDLGDDVAMRCRVAQALLRVGEHRALHALLRHPSVMQCQDGATLALLAHVHQSLGEHVEALAMMQRAQACGFDGADFRFFLAVQLQFNNRLDDAAQALDRALALSPGYGRAALTRARLRRQTASSNHLDQLRQQLQLAKPDSEDRAGLAFALYKELEDLGQTDAAWNALTHGNAVMHARLRHDADAEAALYTQLGALAEQGVFAAQESTNAQGPQPIFVLGLPRSGTTVLERMLGNHSQIMSAGELNDFGHQLRWGADQAGRSLLDARLLQALPTLDYAQIGARYLEQTQWRAGSARWYIDKLPTNAVAIGAIARALPAALIVHLVREPMAVCFSNYRALFGDSYAYSYDLHTLARHYQAYHALMAQWRAALPGRVIDVDYTQMVRDPSTVLEQLMTRCGLNIEPGQIDITRNAAASATLSSVQVREGVHGRNVEEWRRYATQLEPLRQTLLQAGLIDVGLR